MKHWLLKTYIELVNQRKIDLTGKEEILRSEMTLRLGEVESIRQVIDDNDEIDPDSCYVYMKSGQSFIINTPYHVLKKLMEDQSDSARPNANHP